MVVKRSLIQTSLKNMRNFIAFDFIRTQIWLNINSGLMEFCMFFLAQLDQCAVRCKSHAVTSGNWPRVLPAHFTSWRSLPVFARLCGVTIWIMAPCVFFLGSLFIARHIILAPRLILPVQWSTTMFGWIRQLSEKWAVFPLTRSPLLAELLERLSNLFELILINAWRWRRLRPDACKR